MPTDRSVPDPQSPPKTRPAHTTSPSQPQPTKQTEVQKLHIKRAEPFMKKVERANSGGRGAGRVKGKQPGKNFSRPPAKDPHPVDSTDLDVDSPDTVSRFVAPPPPNPQTVRTPNPVTNPNPPPPLPKTQGYVTECSTVYSILMACITTCDTILFAYFAYSSDEDEKEKIDKFWWWIIFPIPVTTMGISFMLKPRRGELQYKIFLYIQFFMFTIVCEFLSFVGRNFEGIAIIEVSLKCLILHPAVLAFCLKSRSHVAELTDKDLSNFLTNDVIMGGGSHRIRTARILDVCEHPGCGMIALYFGIKLLSGVVPKRILEKHMFSIKKVVAMRMNAEESVQAFGLAIAIGCALFMFGNYGAEGDFHNEAEKILLFAVMGTGFACLIVTAAWNMVAIRVELKRWGKILRQGESSSSTSEAMLAGASSFWFYLGVLATTLLSILYVARAATLDESYFTLAMAGLPVVILVYFWSFFCQPRKNSPKNMWNLRLHFAR